MFVKRFPYNSLIGYININSVKEKVISLREVLMLLQILFAQMKLNQTRVSQIINLKLKATSFCHRDEIETQREGENQSTYRVYTRKGYIYQKRIPELEIEKKRKLFALKSQLLRKSGASYSLTVLQTSQKPSFQGNYQWRTQICNLNK